MCVHYWLMPSAPQVRAPWPKQVLARQVENGLRAMVRGLQEVPVPSHWPASAEALQEQLAGEPYIDVDEWRQATDVYPHHKCVAP